MGERYLWISFGSVLMSLGQRPSWLLCSLVTGLRMWLIRDEGMCGAEGKQKNPKHPPHPAPAAKSVIAGLRYYYLEKYCSVFNLTTTLYQYVFYVTMVIFKSGYFSVRSSQNCFILWSVSGLRCTFLNRNVHTCIYGYSHPIQPRKNRAGNDLNQLLS